MKKAKEKKLQKASEKDIKKLFEVVYLPTFSDSNVSTR